MKSILSAAAATALLLSTADAAVTVYDEGIQGDGGDTQLVATDLSTIGANDGVIVRGTVGGSDQYDYFRFTLTDSASVTLTALRLTSPNDSTGFPVYSADSSTNVSFSSDGVGLPTVIAMLDAGTYFVRPAEFSTVSSYELLIGSADAVPVPAAAFLFAPVVAGAGFLRKRHAAH